MHEPLFNPSQVFSLEMKDFLTRVFSTGIPLLDMMIGMALFRVVLWIGSFSEIPIDFGWLLTVLFGGSNNQKHKGQLEFELVMGESNGMIQSPSRAYKSIMYRLSQIEDDSLWKTKETSVNIYDNEQCRYLDEKIYVIAQPDPVQLDKEVEVKSIEIEDVKPTNRGGEHRTTKRQLVLYSDILDAKSLRQRVETWIKEYAAHQRKQLQSKQLIFQVRFYTSRFETMTTDFHTFRAFDNLHFPFKEQVLKELDFFSKRDDWYQSRGLPHTLGILCYGEPGCGKTSFIKALLQYTKRHAVVFSINRYTDLREVERLMRTEEIGGMPIPQEDRVYVFEDVDAMGDLVKKRSQEENEAAGPKPFHEEAALAYMKKQREKKEKKKNTNNGNWDNGDDDSDDPKWDELFKSSKRPENHLSFLLNILDGVIESPGRIVVMTTNFVEKLDPALIRPGRIDLRLEFNRCTRQTIRQILGQFYDVPTEDINLPAEVEDKLITPARIAQLCRAHKRSLPNLLTALLEESKEEMEKKLKQLNEKAEDEGHPKTLWDKVQESSMCYVADHSMLMRQSVAAHPIVEAQSLSEKLLDKSTVQQFNPVRDFVDDMTRS